MQKGLPVESHGKNEAVGANYEPVWLKTGAITFFTIASALTIVSDSVEDDGDKTPAGTGLWTLRIRGLDDNFNPIVEDKTLDGTTAVTTTKEFRRVNEVKALTAAGGGVAIGNITIDNGTDVIAYIPVGYNVALQAIYTVPATKTLRITDIYCSEDQNKETDLAVYYTEEGSDKPKLLKTEILYILKDQKSLHFEEGLKFREKTDVELQVKSAAGAGVVVAGFTGYLN